MRGRGGSGGFILKTRAFGLGIADQLSNNFLSFLFGQLNILFELALVSVGVKLIGVVVVFHGGGNKVLEKGNSGEGRGEEWMEEGFVKEGWWVAVGLF